MNTIMFNLIKNNYEELKEKYIRFNDKFKIVNGSTCEDIFDNKILLFIESDLQNPTVDILKLFLKTKRKEERKIQLVEYKDVHSDIIVETIDDRINYLFVDYKPEKKIKRRR